MEVIFSRPIDFVKTKVTDTKDAIHASVTNIRDGIHNKFTSAKNGVSVIEWFIYLRNNNELDQQNMGVWVGKTKTY